MQKFIFVKCSNFDVKVFITNIIIFKDPEEKNIILRKFKQKKRICKFLAKKLQIEIMQVLESLPSQANLI